MSLAILEPRHVSSSGSHPMQVHAIDDSFHERCAAALREVFFGDLLFVSHCSTK